MRALPFLVVAALVASACGTSSSTSTDIQTARTSDTQTEVTATLAVGDSIAIGSNGLRIKMTGVPDDSRCPKDVVCVWAGDAAVAFAFTGGGATSGAVLHTTLDPKSVVVSGFTIQLLEVTPGTKSGEKIPQSEYRAKIVVRS